jgi:KDO2-lipid IV(A) lauroyltransferase
MLNRLFVLPLLRALNLLAADTASRIGGSLGILVFHIGIRRRVASACVATALGLRGRTRRAVVRRSYASMGASFLELWSVGGVDGMERHLTFFAPNWQHQVLNRHPGCILLSPHLGNWDLGGNAIRRFLPRFIGYAKAQHNPQVDDLVNHQRLRAGIEVLFAEHGERATAVQALRALRLGVPLGLMADQGPGSREGEVAYFLGVPTYCHSGPGFFAKRAPAPIVPCMCLRLRAGRFAMFIGRPLFAGDYTQNQLVQAAMDLLGVMIARFPGQYFWQHRRFKNHLDLPARAVEPWRSGGLRLLAEPLRLLAAAEGGTHVSRSE